MDISFPELRKNLGKLLESLERREVVTLFRRGKPIARIVPVESSERCSASKHPAFGMWADRSEMDDVAGKFREMRKERFDAL